MTWENDLYVEYIRNEYVGDYEIADPTKEFNTSVTFINSSLIVKVNGRIIPQNDVVIVGVGISNTFYINTPQDDDSFVNVSYQPSSSGAPGSTFVPVKLTVEIIAEIREKIEFMYEYYKSTLRWYGGLDGITKGRKTDIYRNKTKILLLHFNEIHTALNDLIIRVRYEREQRSLTPPIINLLPEIDRYYITVEDIENIRDAIERIDTAMVSTHTSDTTPYGGLV